MIPNSADRVRNFFVSLAVVAALSLVNQSQADDAKSTSATDATTPSAQLRSEVGSFRLTLRYEGEHEGQPRDLTLTTLPRETGLDGTWFPQPLVRISRKQAVRIIDQLDARGFLARMKTSTVEDTSSRPALVGRRYGVVLAIDPPGGPIRLHGDLGWGKGLLEWLGQLKSVLEGEALRALGRLEDEQRRSVERESRARPTEPIVANGIEFTAIGETTWTVPKVGAKTDVELSLRVTNRSTKTLRFNRFDTIRIELRDERGRKIPPDGGRNATILLDPLVLHPGGSQILPRRGTLKWDQDGKVLSVGGWDGTNAFWRFGGIRPGRYSLTFMCRNDQESTNDIERFLMRRRIGVAFEGSKPPEYWQGDVTTKALSVRVAEAPPK